MIQWLKTPIALMLTKSIARVAAPPSIKISFRLKDLVWIKSCQHSLEMETIIVRIKEYNKIVFSAPFLLSE